MSFKKQLIYFKIKILDAKKRETNTRKKQLT